MTCAVCGSEKQLQRHHVSYEPEMIIDLCKQCHKKLHRNGTGRGMDNLKRKLIPIMGSTQIFDTSDIASTLNVGYSSVDYWIDKRIEEEDVFAASDIELSEEEQELISVINYGYKDPDWKLQPEEITNWDTVKKKAEELDLI